MATTITMQTVIILFFMLCDINDVFYIGCSIWLKITRLLWITYIWNDFFYSDAIREADNHFLWLGKIKYRTQSRLVEHDILSALLLSRRERASHFLASKCRRLGGTWAFSMSSYLFLITKQAWGLLDFDHKNDSIPSFDMIFSCRHRILETFRLGCFFCSLLLNPRVGKGDFCEPLFSIEMSSTREKSSVRSEICQRKKWRRTDDFWVWLSWLQAIKKRFADARFWNYLCKQITNV